MAEDISEDNVNIIKNRKQIGAILSANFCAFSASILFNWPSPTIPKLLSGAIPDVTEESTSYLPVIPPVVMILMSSSFGYFLNRFGRKYTLLSIAVLHTISFILIAMAKTMWEFYLSRVFFGMADVFMFGSLPIYVAEVSTPKIRGTWGGCMMIFVFLGQFTVNAVGYYCDISTTACILVIAPIMFFISFLFMPETPYHYLIKNRQEEAVKSLKQLRHRKDVDEELERIEADIRKQMADPSKFKDLFLIKSNRSAFLVVLMTIMVQQFCGCASFNIYGQLIFERVGQNINRGYSSMICSVVLAIATICGPILVGKFGRKLSIVTSCFFCAVMLLILAIYFVIIEETDIDLSFMNWFVIIGMIVYFISFGIGLSVVPFMLQGELFATNMRGHASSTMNITLCLSISITSKLFHYLMTSFGLYVPFGFFSLCTFIGMGLCYKFVPETKGKTLEEIQELMKRTI